MLITTGFEVICTLRGLEDFGAGFEGAHETRDGPFGDFAQKGFELGEGFSMGFLEINRFGNPPTDSTRSDTALSAGCVTFLDLLLVKGHADGDLERNA